MTAVDPRVQRARTYLANTLYPELAELVRDLLDVVDEREDLRRHQRATGVGNPISQRISHLRSKKVSTFQSTERK